MTRKLGYVLDIGSGHRPHSDATHLCDLYVNYNVERGKSLIIDERPFVCCSIEYLPFKSDAFYFVYACHILEHVANPSRAIDELVRTSSAGYIETPTAFSEYFYGWPFHRWTVNFKSNRFIFKSKQYSQSLINTNMLYNRNFAMKALHHLSDLIFGLHYLRVIWGHKGKDIFVRRIVVRNPKTCLCLYRQHNLLLVSQLSRYLKEIFQ